MVITNIEGVGPFTITLLHRGGLASVKVPNKAYMMYRMRELGKGRADVPDQAEIEMMISNFDTTLS